MENREGEQAGQECRKKPGSARLRENVGHGLILVNKAHDGSSK